MCLPSILDRLELTEIARKKLSVCQVLLSSWGIKTLQPHNRFLNYSLRLQLTLSENTSALSILSQKSNNYSQIITSGPLKIWCCRQAVVQSTLKCLFHFRTFVSKYTLKRCVLQKLSGPWSLRYLLQGSLRKCLLTPRLEGSSRRLGLRGEEDIHYKDLLFTERGESHWWILSCWRSDWTRM